MSIKALKFAWKGLKVFYNSRKTSTLLLQRKEAKNFITSIPEDTWNKLSKSIFQQANDPKSKFVQNLADLRTFLKEENILLSPKAEKALKVLERKGNVMAERLNLAVARGEKPLNTGKYGEKFYQNNKDNINIIKNEFDKIESLIAEEIQKGSKNMSSFSRTLKEKSKFEMNFMDYNPIFYNAKIGKVSNDVIKSGQTLYHGTKHGHSIKKQGFSIIPKKSQAIAGSRELGEGVYCTPDKKVAGFFAGLRGSIIPIKADIKNIAAVNDDQILKISGELLKLSPKNSATTELFIKELFKRNGYDGAYTRQAIGFTAEFVDNVIGRKQSQVCIFDNNAIKILSKKATDKISNQLIQTEMWIQKPANLINGFLKLLKKNR